jgi:alpha-tubulin suppressor-like RCC1 family protein
MRGATTAMANLALDTPQTPPPLNSSRRLLARVLCGSWALAIRVLLLQVRLSLSLSLSLSPVSRPHVGPAEGVLYMWGYNASGHLGLGDTDRRLTPTVVSSLSGRRVVDVVSSIYHTVAVTGASWRVYVCECDTCVPENTYGVVSVMAWGSNILGQLGLGTTSANDQLVPVEVPSLRGRRVLALMGQAAWSFTVALLSPSEADRA